MNKSNVDPVLIPGSPFREVASVTPGGGRPRVTVTTTYDMSVQEDRDALMAAIRAMGEAVLVIGDEAHVVTAGEG